MYGKVTSVTHKNVTNALSPHENVTNALSPHENVTNALLSHENVTNALSPHKNFTLYSIELVFQVARLPWPGCLDCLLDRFCGCVPRTLPDVLRRAFEQSQEEVTAQGLYK